MNEFAIKKDDREIKLAIAKLTPKIRLEGDKCYSKAFAEALDNDVLLRCQVDAMLEERGVLDSKASKQKAQKLKFELRSLEVQLKSARKEGRKMTKSEGREIALRMKDIRTELNNIGGDLNEYYSNTVEHLADNERLNYYVFALTVLPDTGATYWKSFQDYKDDEASIKRQASNAFLKFNYPDYENLEKNKPENAWLIRHKFMNNDLQLIDEQGRIITTDGRLINADGRLVNENGQFVDEFGNLVNEDGDLLIEDGWAEDTKPNQANGTTPVLP